MTIAEQVQRTCDAIAAACARARRNPQDVTLVAVSKKKPVAAVAAAAAAGVQHFGENRVEEAVDKIPAVGEQFAGRLTWHMVGHLQSRKAKLAPPLFDMVQSVDSVKLAEKLSALMIERGGQLDVLLEMNVSGEAAKHGFVAAGWPRDADIRERLWQQVATILRLPGLNIRGLMTMAPLVRDAEDARPVFAELAALRAELASGLGANLPELSMGMTDDYPVAIEEGATIVRIGRALFGPRE